MTAKYQPKIPSKKVPKPKGVPKVSFKTLHRIRTAAETAIKLSSARPGGRINRGIIQEVARRQQVKEKFVAFALKRKGYQV